ncbi:hypothetical protein NEILACOT_05235 [Neisseria lactamica ATCC 23970]|uniref:Uncharacterized protein n=2 Tax=Neisseria lactamica TaxID=486 RepID=D0WCF4_NEILA|nr:phenylacetic acid degradation protein PaaD [Neisseria lactamica]EEZ74718.1 hypothetical protein NEILACOT_05235 [Neisseria lactamica ATCC 23970]
MIAWHFCIGAGSLSLHILALPACPCQRLPYPEASKSFKLAQSGCLTVWVCRPSVLPAERI